MRIRLFAVPWLVALAGCRTQPDLAKERAAILRTDEEWASAAAARDVERSLSYWSEDAVVFAPDQPAIRGKDAIRAYITASFKIPGFAIRWHSTDVTVSPGGDMAYASGTNEVRLTGPDGTPLVLPGKAVTVWRKAPNGDWKCVIDIWNGAGPTPASPDPRPDLDV